MSTIVKKRAKKAGLPPGSLVYTGEKRPGAATISVMDYDESRLEERQITRLDECFRFKDSPSVTWIDVDGVHDVDAVRKLGECYGFHPLMSEDIVNPAQRPKIEVYGNTLYIVLRMLSLDKARGITIEQASLVLGNNFLFSFQEGKSGDVFGPVRERIRNEQSRMRKLGPDFLAYALMDVIVLERGDSPLVQAPTRIYLRDLYDHTVQVMDTVETYRDMLSGMIDIYLSSLSNRMNEVMKTLTIIATVFMPLTFVVGIYGMNFKYMPELEWRWAYPAVLGLLLVIASAMVVYFRKKKCF